MNLCFIKAACLFMGVGAVLSANAALDDISYLGINKYIQMGGSRNGYAAGGNGGAFTGTAYNGPTPGLSTESTLTTFWCVDSQLSFNLSDFGGANIIGLNSISAPIYAGKVRYGDVDQSGAPTWTNSLGAAFDSAQERYKAAAFLITQYEFNAPGGPQDGIKGGASSALNDSIQQTIWQLMSNTSQGGQTGTFDTTGFAEFGGLSAIAYATSAANATTVANMAGWAVVSWSANGGDLIAGQARQTFLVQLVGPEIDPFNTVPEPGFYGLLCSGLGALIWAANRRKKNAETTV